MREYDSIDARRRIVFYGVKFFSVLDYESLNQSSLQGILKLNDAILATIIGLTPAELLSIFPPDKIYDGNRYETKDYFYTIEALQEHGLNEPIRTSDEALSLLWDYTNKNIMTYQVKLSGVISALLKIQTGKSLIEEFFEKEGFTLHKQTIN